MKFFACQHAIFSQHACLKKSHIDMQKNSCQHASHHVNMQVTCQHAAPFPDVITSTESGSTIFNVSLLSTL